MLREDTMGSEMSHSLRPWSPCLAIFLAALLLIFFAFSISQQEEEKVEEVHEITRRFFLDVDIDKQRTGRLVIGLYGQVVARTTGMPLVSPTCFTFCVVSTVNSGPNSNGSQFFSTTVKASWLEGEHVVFGQVIEGVDSVFATEGGTGTYSGKPRKKVIIAHSGEIPKSKWDEDNPSLSST